MTYPDPREANCVRQVRKGPHVWTDLPPHPRMCRYCGRRHGRRYSTPQQAGAASSPPRPNLPVAA